MLQEMESVMEVSHTRIKGRSSRVNDVAQWIGIHLSLGKDVGQNVGRIFSRRRDIEQAV